MKNRFRHGTKPNLQVKKKLIEKCCFVLAPPLLTAQLLRGRDFTKVNLIRCQLSHTGLSKEWNHVIKPPPPTPPYFHYALSIKWDPGYLLAKSLVCISWALCNKINSFFRMRMYLQHTSVLLMHESVRHFISIWIFTADETLSFPLYFMNGSNDVLIFF